MPAKLKRTWIGIVSTRDLNKVEPFPAFLPFPLHRHLHAPRRLDLLHRVLPRQTSFDELPARQFDPEAEGRVGVGADLKKELVKEMVGVRRIGRAEGEG